MNALRIQYVFLFAAALCAASLLGLSPLYSYTGVVVWTEGARRSNENYSKTEEIEEYGPDSLEGLYEKRRQTVMMECLKHQQKRSPLEKKIYGKNIYFDPVTNSLYCGVPKAGCSTWKRLFLILHNNQTEDPFSMSGLDIHGDRSLAKLRFDRVPSNRRASVAKKAFTFMFARDPFHRVFSAYCDKMFMMSYQTSRLATTIRGWAGQLSEPEEKLAKSQGRSTDYKGDAHVYTGPEFNITFAEALNYATLSKDPHFKLISKLCDPCAIDFKVLGRMKSLDIDSHYVLEKLNRSHILDHTFGDEAFKQSHEESIIRELVQRVFKTLRDGPTGTSKFKALVRTWKVFHIRGLIHDTINYPLTIADTANSSSAYFAGLATDAMRRSGNPAERRAQRRKYYQAAFRSVPLGDLIRFSKFAMPDCRLFGYDCIPDDIFRGRKNGDEEDNIFSNDKYLY